MLISWPLIHARFTQPASEGSVTAPRWDVCPRTLCRRIAFVIMTSWWLSFVAEQTDGFVLLQIRLSKLARKVSVDDVKLWRRVSVRRWTPLQMMILHHSLYYFSLNRVLIYKQGMCNYLCAGSINKSVSYSWNSNNCNRSIMIIIKGMLVVIIKKPRCNITKIWIKVMAISTEQ